VCVRQERATARRKGAQRGNHPQPKKSDREGAKVAKEDAKKRKYSIRYLRVLFRGLSGTFVPKKLLKKTRKMISTKADAKEVRS